MIPLDKQIRYMENLLKFVEEGFPELVEDTETTYTQEKYEREVATIQAILHNLKTLPTKPQQTALPLQSHCLD